MVFDLNDLFQGGILVTAFVAVGLGAFKLGSRQRERGYRGKSAELAEMKSDPMAGARRVIENSIENFSATIARLTSERIMIEQELVERENRLENIMSQSDISDDRLNYIQEQKEKSEAKLTEYDITLEE